MSEWVNIRIERSVYNRLNTHKAELNLILRRGQLSDWRDRPYEDATLSDAIDDLLRRVSNHRARSKKQSAKGKKRRLYLHEQQNLETTGKVAGAVQSPGQS